MNPPRLTIKQILTWADAQHTRMGKWPTKRTGRAVGASGRIWGTIDWALRQGRDGLEGGSSLARLLEQRRGVPNRANRPKLTINATLTWADQHLVRTGRWPTSSSGVVHDAPRETWNTINIALKEGYRGFRGGSSLATLLAKYRGKRFNTCLPRVSVNQILTWADAHHRRTGQWPTATGHSRVVEVSISWLTINKLLKRGGPGLRGGSSLAKPLRKARGIWDSRGKPPLTTKLILQWADAHFQRTSRWPNVVASRVHECPKQTWVGVNQALQEGQRGLRGGSSLARLLAKHRAVPNLLDPPPFTIKQILAWADAHHELTGNWPIAKKSGAVVDATDFNITWGTISSRLARGGRGLRGGSTLPQLLAKYRGVRNLRDTPRLSIKQILAWSDAHHQRAGKWATVESGRLKEAPDETWGAINFALSRGRRGLRGRSSLTKLLIKHRGIRDRLNPARLTIKQILAWADAHYERTGDWPSRESGRVQEAPDESWPAINDALKRGSRGLSGPSSLVKLLTKYRKTLYQRKGVPLKRSQILEWARAHHERTGRLPTKKSGPVREQRGETWSAIDAALSAGSRTLAGGSSLPKLLKVHYREPFRGAGRPLTISQILAWADAFRARVGRWPTRKSAYADPTRREKWSTIDLALREGNRGLPGGSSLYTLLMKRRFRR